MKKLILSMAMVAAFATFAEDTIYQVLYWQVADDASSIDGAAYACLYASLDGDSVRIDGVGQQLSDVMGNKSSMATLQGTAPNFNWGSYAFTDADFYVELLNENWDAIAKSEGIAYANLKPYIDLSYAGSGVIQKATGAAVFSGYTAVPEPTSGLLMLLGVAGLALRRRRA